MKLRNISQLIAVTTLTTLSLVACGSSAEESSTEAVGREAGIAPPRNVKLCVSREANAGPMTVTFQNSESSAGNGPFNLDYGQCGESPINGALRLDIYDAEGTRVLFMAAMNMNIGYPEASVSYVVDRVGYVHAFSEGETHTFNVGPYSVRVQRQTDSDTAKNFIAWVSRP